jgi:flavodoxin
MAKKLFWGIAAVCIFLSATCQSTGQQAGKQDNLGKVLILYYTWSEQANTENAAKIIQGLTGADMIKVEPATPFPELDSGAFIAWGQGQRENQSWPEIKELGVNPASYDFIFIGTPVWYGSVSFPIETLLINTDFGGKPVACFAMANSNEGQVLTHFENKVKNGQVRQGIALRMRNETEVSAKITQWVNGLQK